MAKIKFKSKYSPAKEVTAAQYITELICERKAALTGSELPIFFWKLSEWTKFYKNQIFSAYKILKCYDVNAVINAIRSPEAKRQYSLRSPKLIQLYQKEQEKIDKITENIKKEEIGNESIEILGNESPRPPMIKGGNQLNKLRNI